MHIKSVPFENHPDSLMNDWIISLELVEIAIKQLFYAIKLSLHFKSDLHQTYAEVRYANEFSSFQNHPDWLMHDWIISLEIVEIAIIRLVCAKKSTFQNRSSPNLNSF